MFVVGKVSTWWTPRKEKRRVKRHESLAHAVKEMIIGGEQQVHTRKQKRALKALQSGKSAQKIVNILKEMPEPMPIVEVDSIDAEPTAIPPSVAAELMRQIDGKNSKNLDPKILRAMTMPVTAVARSVPAAADVVATEAKCTPTVNNDKTADTTGTTKSATAIVTKSTDDDTTSTTTTITTISKIPEEIFRPPLTEVSAYLHWWGYEIYVPKVCMGRLDQVQNVSQAFLGFLRAVTGNVVALTPYWGFISAWVGFQFSVIKSQDTGHGVVLASTWVLPVAIIPRPWDAPID